MNAWRLSVSCIGASTLPSCSSAASRRARDSSSVILSTFSIDCLKYSSSPGSTRSWMSATITCSIAGTSARSTQVLNACVTPRPMSPPKSGGASG